MSKKSNAFQRAILYIHEQLDGTSASVIESAELEETNIEEKILREIDVLIEKELEGKIFRIAIECRDRSNKDDIQWIDSLIGKYKNLPVNRVIAVSNSGFSKNATFKAAANKIEIRQTKELNAVDWKNEYTSLGFCDFKVSFEIKNIIVALKKGEKIPVVPGTLVFDGENEITFYEFVKFLNKSGWSKRLLERFNQKFPKLYKTRADLEKPAIVEHSIPVSNFQIEVEGEKQEIISVTAVLLAIPKVNDIYPDVRKYEESLITRAEFENEDIEKKFVIFATQAKAADNQINIGVDRKKMTKK